MSKAIIKSTLLYSLLLSNLFTAPLLPVKHASIKGKVTAFTWIDEFLNQQEEVWNIVNPSGSDKTKARYFVILSSTNLTKQERDKLTAYCRNANFAPKILTKPLNNDEVIIMFESKQLKELKIGSTISLKNYELSGDEFGIWESKNSVVSINKKTADSN